jgi:hypothetical protein
MTDGEEEAVMIRRAVFGKQVESFLNSDIGIYLLGRARDQKDEAQCEFLSVDCSDIEKVRQLQNTIVQANSIAKWLSDAVADGLQAINIIDDRS